MDYKELIVALGKEMPYQWRVQSRTKDKTKAICTCFIDARDVMNRLDSIGIQWQVDYKAVAGFIFGGISIYVDGQWITKWDCGARIEDDANDQMFEQAGKSAASDALKRAAVTWGVGRFLYDIQPVTLPCDQYGNVVDDTGARVWNLTEHITRLRNKKPAKAAPAKPVETPKTEEVKAPEETKAPEGKVEGDLPPLPQDKLDMMLQYIIDGKSKEVKAAMAKYKLTAAQRTVLNASIKNKEAK